MAKFAQKTVNAHHLLVPMNHLVHHQISCAASMDLQEFTPHLPTAHSHQVNIDIFVPNNLKELYVEITMLSVRVVRVLVRFAEATS